jgi:creatinine amidohydrolase/Fe(II)-dependent formamide hydrolase-like protein
LSLALAGALALGWLSQPRTAPLAETVRLADMTWPEVREAIARGFDTVLVPSGGIEANGPHMTLDKHQHIVSAAAGMIARGHGRMLVAPVIAYTPQGPVESNEGNFRFPGTIGVSDVAFAAVLEGAALSLKRAGFRHIVFIADHGGSQRVQSDTALKLDAAFASSGVRVTALTDYYARGDAEQQAALKAMGHGASAIGGHAGLQDTAELAFAHPASVKLERLTRFSLVDDGSSGAPRHATPELGRQLLDLKVRAALEQLGSLQVGRPQPPAVPRPSS